MQWRRIRACPAHPLSHTDTTIFFPFPTLSFLSLLHNVRPLVALQLITREKKQKGKEAEGNSAKPPNSS